MGAIGEHTRFYQPEPSRTLKLKQKVYPAWLAGLSLPSGPVT